MCIYIYIYTTHNYSKYFPPPPPLTPPSAPVVPRPLESRQTTFAPAY